MWNNFRHTLLRSRGQILGWGLGLALYAGYMAGFFDTLMSMKDQFVEIASNYPPELIAFVGGVDMLFSPSGFLNTYLFSYMPLILGVFAIMVGSRLLIGDEENGTLDLVLGHPISRARLLTSRLLAFCAALALILILLWLGMLIGMQTSSLHFGALELGLPFLSLFGILLFFGSFSLMMSMLLPSSRIGAMAGGILLVGSFFLTLMGNMDERLIHASKVSPLSYFQGGMAIDGMEWSWFLGLVGFSVLFVSVALWRFQLREVRVAGERGFELPRLPFLNQKQDA